MIRYVSVGHATVKCKVHVCLATTVAGVYETRSTVTNTDLTQDRSSTSLVTVTTRHFERLVKSKVILRLFSADENN